jgi:hypothetical protein
VRIEREDAERVAVVACDGRMILAVAVPAPSTEDEIETALVPQAMIRRVAAPDGPPRTKRARVRDVNEVTVARGGEGTRIALSCEIVGFDQAATILVEGGQNEGRFPRWRDIIGVEKPGVTVRVDPRRLARLLLAIADAATDEAYRAVAITIDPAKPDGVLRLAAGRRDDGDQWIEAAAALMVVEAPNSRPAWQPAATEFAQVEG